MDRVWIAFLMVLTIALVRMCDSQKDSTGAQKEGAGARAMWDQLQSRARSQGHSAAGPRDSVSSRSSTESSSGSFHNHSARGTPVTIPSGSSSQRDSSHATVIDAVPAHSAGASREDLATVPRDRALRTARQLGSSHRTRVSTRQSSKPSSTNSRRLIG